jgi:hypothetical protein
MIHKLKKLIEKYFKKNEARIIDNPQHDPNVSGSWDW